MRASTPSSLISSPPSRASAASSSPDSFRVAKTSKSSSPTDAVPLARHDLAACYYEVKGADMGPAGSEFSSGIQPAMCLPNRLKSVHSRLPRINPPLLAYLLLATFAVALQPATGQNPSPSFDDLAARAAAARDQQNISLALDLYAQAEQLRPDWAEGWFYLGLLRYQANQFPQAIDGFNHLIQLQPTAVPAIALRGLCEFETADYDDSLRDLEMAVAHGAANEPRNAQIIRFHLAQLLARANRFQDALEQYKFFATEHVDSPDLSLGIGLAGIRVTTLPKDVPAQDRPLFQQAGEAGYAVLAEESERGDALFQALFSQHPSTPNLHLFYGFLLFPHDPSLAVDEFRSELGVAPANETGHAMLAFSLMITGRYAEALPEAEHAYAASPTLQMAQLALGRSLAETGEIQRGTDLLNQVLQKDPNNLEAHLGLASIYSRTGRREDALRERAVCLKLPR
ncbi:tetratricopeptide repeat protein [Acidobacteria bacterium AB60]|nr:tetratricopeptide repeat protein [Acidobacteria bacterium AB60]